MAARPPLPSPSHPCWRLPEVGRPSRSAVGDAVGEHGQEWIDGFCLYFPPLSLMHCTAPRGTTSVHCQDCPPPHTHSWPTCPPCSPTRPNSVPYDPGSRPHQALLSTARAAHVRVHGWQPSRQRKRRNPQTMAPPTATAPNCQPHFAPVLVIASAMPSTSSHTRPPTST